MRVELRAPDRDIRNVAFSHDNHYLASSSLSGTTKIWDLKTRSVVHTLPAGPGPISWSPDGQSLALGLDRALQIWDVAREKLRRAWVGHQGFVSAVAWSPDGRQLLSAGWDRTVRVWNADSGVETHRFLGHGNIVQDAAWSPDQRRLVSGSMDGTVRVWNVGAPRSRAETLWHGTVGVLAWNPNGTRLAVGGANASVKIIDPNSALSPIRLPAGEGFTRSLSWSPDGKRLAAADHGRTIRIWETASGRELMQLPKAGALVLWRSAKLSRVCSDKLSQRLEAEGAASSFQGVD
jgi:WD40 repeat protein